MPQVELVSISKWFGALKALDGVSLALPPGRVHGLLGENGAGKSTLMNVLYGLLRPDGGEIRIGSPPAAVEFRSPADAIASGIGMVHQHFMLAPALTVLDNVLLGDRRQGQWLDRKQAARRIEALSAELNLPVDPYARVETLSVGEQQRVEIVKALYRDVETLVLDEPTAVLTPGEIEQLLGALRGLAERGKGVVLITHKLGEVRRVCDDVTVLRRGKVVWSGRAAETSSEELAVRMVGEEAGVALAKQEGSRRAAVRGVVRAEGPVLELRGVSAEGLGDVSLEVGPEIVGVAGVDGNGQQELAEVILGLRRVRSGQVLLAGEEVARLSARRRFEMGVGHVPNDRKLEGLVGAMSVVENLGLKRVGHEPFSRRGVLTMGRARELARRLVARFDVRAAGVEGPVAALSGGNQQKVVLARELAMVNPKLLVAMNPTRGLDVAATRAVHRELVRQKEAGCAVLLISSELEELMALSDRLGVLYRGRLVMTKFPQMGAEEIGALMAGVGVRGEG